MDKNIDTPKMQKMKDILIYKKHIMKLLMLTYPTKHIKLNDIQILGFHYYKGNYNFLYNKKKYIIKEELYNNIKNEIIKDKLNISNVDEIIYKINQIFINVVEFNKIKHFPNILENTLFFFIVEFLDFDNFSIDDFFANQKDIMKIFDNNIFPMSISYENIGKVNNQYVFYDFDALCTLKMIKRKYIHARIIVNNTEKILFKGDVEDVKLFHRDMIDNIIEYKG